MLDSNGEKNPSAFIPFCNIGNNTFFSNSTYSETLGLPVCDMFVPTLLDGRLCYKVDMDRFEEDITYQKGKGYGLNFLMDYNEDRMANVDVDEEDYMKAMIYIETLGKIRTNKNKDDQGLKIFGILFDSSSPSLKLSLISLLALKLTKIFRNKKSKKDILKKKHKSIVFFYFGKLISF